MESAALNRMITALKWTNKALTVVLMGKIATHE